ncbi:carbohydrate-binding protein [Kineosporia babensis]|uniref:Uncharacterized protein n=1 Tax=Kineosporia babensis TaxID=499548 RepID=A0A9X1NFQ8_9ACTN|nr:hypothetical protein [Kineosporia babensis]MCD5312228.1 hypothetical protein [Kineosporia babensis]
MTSRSRTASSPWLGIGLLSLVVAGSSLAVPRVLPTRTSGDAPTQTVAAPTSTPAPEASTPSSVSTATTTVAAPTTTQAPTQTPTPSATPTTKKPRPKPTFEPLTINPWAKIHDSSGIEVTECPLCVSGKRVQYLGQGHYVIVRLKDVEVPGKRTMTVIYTCACDDEPRELDVMVNSDPVRTVALKGARSWDSPDRTTMRITLAKGENVIRFFNQEAPAPDLDQILIR